MSIRQLQTLIAIADHGSFGAAADATYLTQSAVSMQMRALEDERRVELFDRSKRPPVLNAYGRRVVDRARVIVALYARMVGSACDADDLSGPFGNAYSRRRADDDDGIVPQALAALRANYPKLQVSVACDLSASLMDMLEKGQIDAAVISEPAAHAKGISWRQIAAEPLIVIAPIDASGTSPRQVLEELPYLRFNRLAWVGRLIEDYLKENAIEANVSMELDNLEVISTMVFHGLGASIVPLRCIESPLQLPLKRLPLEGAPRRVLGFAEPTNNLRARLTDALFAALRRLGRSVALSPGHPISSDKAQPDAARKN